MTRKYLNVALFLSRTHISEAIFGSFCVASLTQKSDPSPLQRLHRRRRSSSSRLHASEQLIAISWDLERFLVTYASRLLSSLAEAMDLAPETVASTITAVATTLASSPFIGAR